MVVALLFIPAVMAGCGDSALALVDLDLEVNVQEAGGEPVAHADVWLVDHALPKRLNDRDRWHFVCTTDPSGQCLGEVKYTYDVTYWPWTKRRGSPTSALDYELVIKSHDGVTSLGYLPRMTSLQLHGFEQVRFTAVVPDRP